MQKKYKKFQIKKAFSLVELSIVILITSILITGALGVSKTSKDNDKVQITKERMDMSMMHLLPLLLKIEGFLVLPCLLL
ncbi:MAG: prepilin-type N-terminal cleavage/methylation domain-containing protein [Rickettsiales bacterium]|jgi:prepilin-type N-terminal cleavage/methylation domain-containing protein